MKKHVIKGVVVALSLIGLAGSQAVLANESTPTASHNTGADPINALVLEQTLYGWTITGNQVLDLNALKSALPGPVDGPTMAGLFVGKYRAMGYLSVQARVSTATKTITLIEPKNRVSGKYSDYLPDIKNSLLTQADLSTALVRARQAAAANNEKLNIRIGEVDDSGAVDIVLDGTALTTKNYGGAVSVSTMGPRYASRDVVTTSGYWNIGDGFSLDGSFSKGLADLRTDSKGGDYTGYNIGLTKATPWGNFGLRASEVQFLVGGKNLKLDQRGTVSTYEGTWNFNVTENLRVGSKLSHVEQKTRLGLFDFEDRISSNAAQLNAGYVIRGADYAVSIDGFYEQGLSATHETKSPAPLFDKLDPHYHVAGLNLQGLYRITPDGWNIEASGGGQQGSAGTPPSSQFYAGGPGRSSANHTGTLSGPSGMYGALTLTAPKIGAGLIEDFKGAVPFIGVDGAQVRWDNGQKASLKSALAGFRMDFGQYGQAMIGVAVPIQAEAHAEKKPQVMFSWSMSF